MSAPNLDAMTDQELSEFAQSVDQRSTQRLKAARMFPDNRQGRVKALRALGHYAWNACTARTCRGRGDIQAAQVYELICEQIYDRLPAWARW
jgi:hypothetical protein